MPRAAIRRLCIFVHKLGFVSRLRRVSLIQVTATALITALLVPAPALAHALSDDGRMAVEIKNNLLLFVGTAWTRLLTGLQITSQEVSQEASAAVPAVIDEMPGQVDPPRPERLPIIPTPSQVEREARVVRLETNILEGLTLRPQEQKHVTAVPLDFEGNAVHGFAPTWESSAPEIVSVTPEGEVTAHAIGAAVLSARAGAQTTVASVSVIDTPDPETILSQAAGTAAALGRHDKGRQEKHAKQAQLRRATWSRDQGFWAEETAKQERRNAPVRFARAKAPMFMTSLPTNEIASLFWPENEVGMPPGRTEPGAITPPVAAAGTEMPLSSNYFFSIPLAGLPGRGLSAGLALNYNSRLWHKSVDWPTGNTKMTFDVDTGWPSPGFRLGWGHLDWQADGTNYGHVLVDPDGTRHKLAPITSTSDDRDFETVDGTFIRFYDDVGSGGTVTYPNGTIIKFTTDGPDGLRLPTTITDRNGNRLEVTYVGGVGPKIATIKDTLERYLTFKYDTTTGELIAITAPAYNNGTTDTQVVRFYYNTITLSGTFASPIIKSAPATARVLQYIYFPGTETGYNFRHAAPYGVIDRIARRTGMAVSTTSLTANGTVTDYGDDAAVTSYDYPTTASNLTDAPAYTTRTDDWAGRTASMYGGAAPAHTFARITGSGTVTSQITAPDATTSTTDNIVTKAVARVAAGQWNDGLVEETRVEDGAGVMQAKTVVTWEHDGNSRNHRPESIEATTDGKIRKTGWTYTTFNNVSVIKEFDFDSLTELRRTEYTYETGTSYTGKRLLHLPKIVKVFAGNASLPTARTDYSYDETALTTNSGMTMYTSPGTTRGNVTTVERFAVATSGTPSDTDTIAYDNAGNVREQSASCCRQKAITYTSATKFAYPASVERGASTGPQLATAATYDFNTGLVRTATDENNRTTQMQHEAATLRPTRIDTPDGGETLMTYGDAPINDPDIDHKHTYVRTETKLAASEAVINYVYLDGRGAAARTFRDDVRGATTGSTNGYSTTDTEYDVLGRAYRTSNPYFTDGAATAINPSGSWTTVMARDELGRTTQVKLPDNTTVNTAYLNDPSYPGYVVEATDQAGRKRRSVTNALGQLLRLDEPNSAGSLGTVASPTQSTGYTYNALNNLTQSVQGSQTRAFKHDGLGRLTHEKQVEQKATLDNSGVYLSTGGSWTKVVKYNSLGLVSDMYDARGIRTQITYDTLNRTIGMTYLDKNGNAEGTPAVTHTYDQAASGYYNTGRLTKTETAAVSSTSTPATAQSFKYDQMGRVASHTQSIGTTNYNLSYSYNLAGMLTGETYPSGRVITQTYNEAGHLVSVGGSLGGTPRTYSSNNKYFAHGGLEIENLGNNTKRTMLFNNRLQPTEIKLANTSSGAEIQRYNYSYGVVNASTGTVDATKNTGQVGRADGYNNGNKKWEERYSYDSLGRLDLHAEHRGDNGTLVYRSDYDHDRYGNRMQSSGGQNYYPTGMTPPVMVASSEIQVASNRITTNMAYDDAGNITTDGKFRGMYYQYDANSRMRWASPTASSVDQSRSVYDALGWRVQAVRWAGSTSEQMRHIIYDAFGRQVAEYQVGAGWKSDSIHRGSQVMAMEEPGEVCYLLGDRQGSKRVMLDNSGGVEARHDYMAYGQEVPSTIGMRDSATQKYGVSDNARQRFAQTEGDKATGLEHAKWRKMESDAGRWTSPDPYRTSMRKGNPQSMNRYAYTQNDPVNAVDPSGLEMMIDSIFHDNWGYVSAGAGWGSVSGGFWPSSYISNGPHFGGPAVITAGEGQYNQQLEGFHQAPEFTGEAWYGYDPQKSGQQDLPNFARRLYIDRGQRLTDCINTVFGQDAADLQYQQIWNAPNVDYTTYNTPALMERTGEKAKAVTGTIDPDLGPYGTLYISSDLALLGDLSELNLQQAYVHELGNVLDARLNRDGKNGRPRSEVYGNLEDPDDVDTGKQLEDCVYRKGNYGQN